MTTTNSAGTQPHPVAQPHALGGVGVSKPDAAGGIAPVSRPAGPIDSPPLQPPGAVVPPDRGGSSAPPLTPGTTPLPARPDDFLQERR